MSNLTKKIVAIVTTVTCAVFLMGPGVAYGLTAEELQAQIDTLMAQLAELQAQLGELEGEEEVEAVVTIEGVPAGFTFENNLKQGMSGDEVKYLQIVLNSDPDTQLAAEGVGSSGNETTYFGPLTSAGVVKFQEKYADEVLASWGLTAGTGFVGSTSRDKLNALLGVAVPAEEEEEEEEGVEEEEEEGVPTEATLGLAPDTPGASVVAAGSQNVVFTKVNFTAGSEAYTITAMSVLRGGVSADTNLSNVKLYDGATQLGSSQAINTNTHKALFGNLSWVIPANSTKTLTIKGSVASGASAGNSIVLGISVLTDITTTGTLTGTFPINGSAKTVATQAVGTFTANVLTTPSASSPLSGSVEQHVGTLQLTSATEGFDVNSIKLTQVGTAGDADVFNVKIKYGATLLGTVADVSSASVTFTGSPIINIPVGSSKNLDIYVDILSGISTSRSVIWEVTQAADIEAVGANSGGLVTVTAAGTWPEQGATHTISQGALTTALDAATNPSAQNYVIGTTARKMTALKFSAGSVEGVRVTQITLTLGGTGSATDISNVALYDGDTLISGPSGVSGTTVQFGVNTINTFDSTGLFDIAASGNKVIMVKADVPSGASSSATISLSVASAANVKADGLLSEMDIPAASVTGTATGNAHTVTAQGSLAVSLNATSPAAQTLAKGVAGKEVAKYSLTAGSGEDIIVSTIILRLWKDGSGDSTTTASGDITDVSLWDGANKLGTTVASPGATASFNANLTVPAGTVKIITVKASVPTGTTASSVHFDLEAGTAGDMVSTGVGSLAAITETGDALGNLMTIGTPTLAVAAGSVPIAASKVTNTSGVVMTSLLLTAGTAENVKVSQIKVSFDSSNTLAAASTASTQFSNVKLMDGSTQIGPIGGMQISDLTPDSVTFIGIENLTVAAGQTKQISVVVDVVGTSGTWYSGHATSGAIVGSGSLSNTSVSSTGGVQSGTALTISSSGGLTVAVDANTPVSANIAVGNTEGAAGIVFSKIKFTSTIEDVKISRVLLTRSGGANTDFGAVYLYDGTTLLGTGYMSGGTVTFNFGAGDEIVIPAASDKVITVKSDLNAIASGVTHADAPILYVASTTGDIDSTGKDSQQPIAETDGSPSPMTTSNFGAMTLYKTTATVSLNALSPSGSSIAAAAGEVLRVDVANNGTYDLTVTSFDVTPVYSGTTTGTTVTSLYWSTDLSTAIATGSAFSVSGSGTGITISPSSNNTVASGATKTLVVKGDTTGLTTNNAFHLDLAAVADFGWTPAGGSEVLTLTKNLPITGGTLTY